MKPKREPQARVKDKVFATVTLAKKYCNENKLPFALIEPIKRKKGWFLF